ncbi:recombinase family protein [Amycolatopsis sp. NBC_00345]|uniref:recombinase family protein n=1 Tax=Amycolatopsis sp. NBC_00345 TaxID=2975955 RepID=UPI003FA45CED
MAKGLTKRVARSAAGELPPLRAVIYARASNATKARRVSVSSQIAYGRKFCKQYGIVVVKVLVDNNLSGSRYETEIRADYEEVLRLLAVGEVNLLWTWENSRAQLRTRWTPSGSRRRPANASGAELRTVRRTGCGLVRCLTVSGPCMTPGPARRTGRLTRSRRRSPGRSWNARSRPATSG